MNDSAELRRITEVERQAALDDLLSRWHWWQASQRFGRDINPGGHATSEYHTPLSYHDEADADEAIDAKLETHTMRQIDFEVRQLPDPWRSAIYALARSLYTGAAVFHSPRILPQDRARVTAEARERLTVRLISAGVM